MQTRRTAMLMGSFIGDALALGAHWVYNTNVIDRKFGEAVDRYQTPLTSYHSGKTAGHFTHYGDQMLVLLEATAAEGGYAPEPFAQRWQAFFQTYEGYFDKATKTTLENMRQAPGLLGRGSSSDDLAGAARLAPLVYRYWRRPQDLESHARSQTAVTHDNEQVVEAAGFLADVTVAVLNGDAPGDGVARVLDARAFSDTLRALVAKGLDSRGENTRETIAAFGQMCSVQAALPSAFHLIASYESDFKRALVENVLAGGDSAARGLVVGMVLGAHLGINAIPENWRTQLAAANRIQALAAAIDAAEKA